MRHPDGPVAARAPAGKIAARTRMGPPLARLGSGARAAAALAGCLAVGTVGGCHAMPAPEADRAALVTLLETQAAAWNRGDLDAFAEGYWRSPALCFTSGGKIARGFDAMRARYRATYPDRAAMGRLTFGDLEVHLLPPDAAWILGRWALARDGGAGVGGVFTLVCERAGDAWRIVHDHTSVAPAAPAPPSSPERG